MGGQGDEEGQHDEDLMRKRQGGWIRKGAGHPEQGLPRLLYINHAVLLVLVHVRGGVGGVGVVVVVWLRWSNEEGEVSLLGRAELLESTARFLSHQLGATPRASKAWTTSSSLLSLFVSLSSSSFRCLFVATQFWSGLPHFLAFPPFPHPTHPPTQHPKTQRAVSTHHTPPSFLHLSSLLVNHFVAQLLRRFPFPGDLRHGVLVLEQRVQVLYGSVVGAMFGAVIFAVVQQGIFFTGWDSDWFRVFLGVMLLGAVIFNNYIRKSLLGSR